MDLVRADQVDSLSARGTEEHSASSLRCPLRQICKLGRMRSLRLLLGILGTACPWRFHAAFCVRSGGLLGRVRVSASSLGRGRGLSLTCCRLQAAAEFWASKLLPCVMHGLSAVRRGERWEKCSRRYDNESWSIRYCACHCWRLGVLPVRNFAIAGENCAYAKTGGLSTLS